MTTTIELLSTQHQDVLTYLAAVEAEIGAPGGADLATFAGYLEAEVMHHFELEEHALFPLLENHLPTTHGPLAIMNAEHVEFRQLLQGLAAAVRAGALVAQRAQAADLIALLRGHIAKEDQVLFPMAERLLSREELGEVERRAAALATTRTASSVAAPEPAGTTDIGGIERRCR
jgi:hemerythrin-like domain-containing protein